jgi:hypothetical protein
MEINFFIVFLNKTSAVHLLLRYKIHFTLSLGSKNSFAISGRLLRPFVETGNDKFKMAAFKPD